jgi:hypothetical protein
MRALVRSDPCLLRRATDVARQANDQFCCDRTIQMDTDAAWSNTLYMSSSYRDYTPTGMLNHRLPRDGVCVPTLPFRSLCQPQALRRTPRIPRCCPFRLLRPCTSPFRSHPTFRSTKRLESHTIATRLTCVMSFLSFQEWVLCSISARGSRHTDSAGR